MFVYLKSLREDFAAWRRGERRVGARGSRGRVFVKRDGTPSDPAGAVEERKRTIKLTARVFRAAGGPIEHYNLVEREI